MQRIVQQTVAVETWVDAYDSGDYIMADKDECLLAVERKTWGDLVGSITGGRLFRQLERMQDTYDYSVLMIEGKLEVSIEGQALPDQVRCKGGRLILGGQESNCTNGFVQMTLFSLQRQYPLNVMLSSGIQDTANLIRVLYERGQKECYGISTRMTARSLRVGCAVTGAPAVSGLSPGSNG